MITLAKVKLYCRIDADNDDQLLDGFITSAVDLIKQQSGKNTYIGDGKGEPVAIEEIQLFQTCVCQLVEHWYDRRGAADNVQHYHLPFTVDTLIAHFKYSCEYTYRSQAEQEEQNGVAG